MTPKMITLATLTVLMATDASAQAIGITIVFGAEPVRDLSMRS